MLGHSARHPRVSAAVAGLLAAPMTEPIDERFEHPLPKGFLASLALTRMNQDGSALGLIYLGLMQRVGVSMLEGGTGALPKALHPAWPSKGVVCAPRRRSR